MVVNFTGGVIGSATSATVYEAGGWGAVCVVGMVASVLALVAWPTEASWPLRRMRHEPDTAEPTVIAEPPTAA